MKRLLKWYYGSASIRKKLVISYLLLITVPILVLGVYSYSVSKRNMERQTEETIRNNVRLMASDLETSLKRENDNIKYLSYNATFRQGLKISRGNQVEVAQVLNEVVEPIFWYFITSDYNMTVGRVGKNPHLDGIVDRQMLLFFQPFKVGPDEFRLIFP